MSLVVFKGGVKPLFGDSTYQDIRLNPNWGLPKVLSFFSTPESLESWESICNLYERHRDVFQNLESKIEVWTPTRETEGIRKIWNGIFGYLKDRAVDSQKSLFADLFMLKTLSKIHGRRELDEHFLSERHEEHKREDFGAASTKLAERMQKKFG